MKWYQKLVSLFKRKKRKMSTNEAINVVASLAKAKQLHKKLLIKTHPDRHLDKIELATELSSLVNENRYNYEALLQLEKRIETEL